MRLYNGISDQFLSDTSDDVSNEVRRGEWRIQKNEQKANAHEIPFSSLIGADNGDVGSFHEFCSEEQSPEELILREQMLNLLQKTLDSLPSDSRALIDAIYFKGMSERKFAREIGVPKSTVHDRRVQILLLMREEFRKNNYF